MATIAESNSLFEIDMELDQLFEKIEEQAQSEGQFGMDPPSTVGAPRCGMYGADLLGEPDVADRALRGLPRPPFVVPRLGHRQQPAGQLHG